MSDLTALYREDATNEEIVAALQHLIDTGAAWLMDGSTGRACAAAIDAGDCLLGEVGHTGAYGNYVPSRYEVLPGTKGSKEYAEARCQ